MNEAMMGDNGAPIGVPNFCLYSLSLKVKYVEPKIKCKTVRNSFLGILQQEDMCIHLLDTLSIARSIGILVKSDTASNETNTNSSLSGKPLNFFISWKLLSKVTERFRDIVYMFAMISCKYLARK